MVFGLELKLHHSKQPRTVVLVKDCGVVAHGCFFLPEHLQCEGGGRTKSPALSSPLMLRLFLFDCVPSLAFSIFPFPP